MGSEMCIRDSLSSGEESDICVVQRNLTSVYMRGIFHLCSGEESDICVVRMNLTSVYLQGICHLCSGEESVFFVVGRT